MLNKIFTGIWRHPKKFLLAIIFGYTTKVLALTLRKKLPKQHLAPKAGRT
jgi:hypothetical protein